MYSTKPGKQRKNLFNAPFHKMRKSLSAHLEENLLLKYDKRAIPVIKGDTVKVMRGSFRGHEDKVAEVNMKDRTIEIEGITLIKAKGDKIARPIHPSNVTITKLNLTDKWRRKKLERGLSEETKKEIEKEAEKQIKEEEKVKEEEQKILEEAKEEAEKTEEPEEKETEEKIVEKKPAPKAKTKKEETKTEKKKTTPKKQSEKKSVKKTIEKTTEKKEESK